ncbi:MAG: hypothetical protein GY697_21015 [Desulfobacterales bacterium]|nr:hypothetical protein [Desulfobacterales bacterium]
MELEFKISDKKELELELEFKISDEKELELELEFKKYFNSFSIPFQFLLI